MTKKHAVAVVGGQFIPVEITGTPKIMVRPIDGHMGDGREPEMEVNYESLVLCADANEAQAVCDRRNTKVS